MATGWTCGAWLPAIKSYITAASKTEQSRAERDWTWRCCPPSSHFYGNLNTQSVCQEPVLWIIRGVKPHMEAITLCCSDILAGCYEGIELNCAWPQGSQNYSLKRELKPFFFFVPHFSTVCIYWGHQMLASGFFLVSSNALLKFPSECVCLCVCVGWIVSRQSVLVSACWARHCLVWDVLHGK